MKHAISFYIDDDAEIVGFCGSVVTKTDDSTSISCFNFNETQLRTENTWHIGHNGKGTAIGKDKEDHMEKCQEAEGIGCVSCPYGPGNFEEYAIAQKDPTKYCSDAYSDRAQHCRMYNKN